MNRTVLLRLSRLVSPASSAAPRLRSHYAREPRLARFLSTARLPIPPVSTPQPTNNLQDQAVPHSAPPDQPHLQPIAAQAPSDVAVTPIPDVVVDTSSNATAVATEAAASVTDAAAAADAAASLSDWWLQPALTLINFTHDITGLPWYLAIAASTLAIRTMLLPATLFTMRNSARMQAIQSDIAERREAVLEAARAGNQELARQRQTEMQTFMRNAGVSPMRVFVGPLIQFPVFISFFVGIRRLSAADPSFATGGAAWFVDLASKDPTFVLPIICGISLFGMTELGGDTGTKMTPQMRNGMRGIAALSVPLTYWFPTAVFCYWIPNNIFSIALAGSVRTKSARDALGLKVDASSIPGTRASRELTAKMAAMGRQTGMVKEVDVGSAVASYARSASPGEKVVQVKPVLLKQRPKKKKAEVSGR